MPVESDGDMADAPRPDLHRKVFHFAIREAVAILDADALVVGWNEALGRLTGYPTGHVEGRHVSSFWPGWGEVSATIDRQATIRDSWQFEGAPPVVVDVTVEPIAAGPGGPAGFALIVHTPGLSEGEVANIPGVGEWRREELERIESDRLTRSVLDSRTENIAILDERGKILRVNRAWRDFAKENGAVIPIFEGVNYLEICDQATGKEAEYAAEIAIGIREVLAGTREEFAMEYPCQSLFRHLWFRVQVIPFQGEGPPRVIVSHLNITERRATEEALKHHANRLEILRSIDRSIVAARTPEEIAATILVNLAEHIPCRWGLVETYDLETTDVRQLARQGVAPPSSSDADDGAKAFSGSYPRSSLQIPLMQDGRMVGSLRIGAEPSTPFREEQAELAREVAEQFAIALRQALLHEEIASAKERLEKLSRRLIRAEEDERRRIARELHDEIGQSLTAVKIHIQATALALDDASRARPRLEEGMSIVEGTLRQIRSISLDLRPSLLDDFGLVAALRSLLNTQARLGGFATHLRVVAEDPEFRLEPELETACFRVAQESLTNVVRYAEARYVEVEIRRGSRELELSVHDDGAGFDTEVALDRATSGESFGLLGIRERVALLGGQVNFQSSPGQGSKVFARFPLASDPPPPPESSP